MHMQHHKQIQIGSSTIGEHNPSWLIAEAGVNHNGSMSLAIELIHAAKEAGADCVKFQTFKATELVTQDSPKARYQLENTDTTETQFQMLKALELQLEDFAQLKEECDRVGIVFMSTPYNTTDVDLLESIGVEAYKVASAMAVEPVLLRRLARTQKPILLSTGMCSLEEVNKSVALIRTGGNEQIITLQCTTDYPAELRDVNLRAMHVMESETQTLCGYSDHCSGSLASLAAVANGAKVIEKHFTLDKSLPGPDHSASSNPDEFREFVRQVRDIELLMGKPEKAPTPRELENKYAMRRGIIAIKSLNAGHVLSESDLGFRRPLDGIAASDIDQLIGAKLSVDLSAGQTIVWDDIV